ncbi:MAG: CBS domain-containing protein, partial [Candidatus Omnitrophota bacterium]
LILNMVLRGYAEKERILAFSVGTVLLVTGISLAADVSLLLAVMTLGIIVVNFSPQKSKEAFSLVEGFTPPIYVLFFVLVGAKLKFSHMTLSIAILVLTYLLFTLAGKAIGSNFGAKISKSPKRVAKYLPFALFSQAGVAIGLSILAAQHFPGQIGDTLVIIVTATTFITQIIGPPFTKLAITKSGEAGLNVTEDDIVRKTTARDVMDKEPPIIYEGMQLSAILQIFSDSDNLFYPVISKDKTMRGIITIEGIKQTFLEIDTGGLILAHDLMEPIIEVTSANAPLSEVKEIFNRHDIECLPVTDKNNKMEGFIERKKLNRFISTKIIELQKQLDTLD